MLSGIVRGAQRGHRPVADRSARTASESRLEQRFEPWFRDQIAQSGIASATLEAVAKRAGVPKGGLLYHFASKAALIEELAERLEKLTRANLDLADREGIVATFLRTSLPDEDEARAYWAVFAAARSRHTAVSDATLQNLANVFEIWTTRLRESIPDQVTADIIRLFGDGLYLAAVTGLPIPDDSRIDALFDRLNALAETPQNLQKSKAAE